jgi:D-lactate dehydrogenase
MQQSAELHRFVAAGAATHLASVERRGTGGIVSLDVALPCNSDDWFRPLPPDLNG